MLFDSEDRRVERSVRGKRKAFEERDQVTPEPALISVVRARNWGSVDLRAVSQDTAVTAAGPSVFRKSVQTAAAPTSISSPDGVDPAPFPRSPRIAARVLPLTSNTPRCSQVSENIVWKGSRPPEEAIRSRVLRRTRDRDTNRSGAGVPVRVCGR